MEVFHVTSYRHCSGVVYHVRCDIATTDGEKGIFLVANRGLLVYDCWRIVVVPCSLHRRCQLACKGVLHTSTQAAKRKQKKRQKQHKLQTDNVQVQRSNFIVRETDQRLPEGHCPSPSLCRWVLNNQFPSNSPKSSSNSSAGQGIHIFPAWLVAAFGLCGIMSDNFSHWNWPRD